MHKKIPDSYSQREGGNPGNSGLLSQQKMVVHYPRTVWKNSYAGHKVTGKTYNKKKSVAVLLLGVHTHHRPRLPGWYPTGFLIEYSLVKVLNLH